ncbi:6-carboxytetrahydropterin synthase [Thiospirillum jenense]|uniref:6-carboxy-5,6,7,8-tetrahydropterin synthase n=1 Tax=Thiospirillum jenense TaxID=1653858 RepID=A0A839HGY1_9GAMM|nr:6-carboxytetrahydropterin synthase [Thiospirillum jenense]MBB1126348.1 6-carboxytetrahydropterin synthase [Thiospirillum jenense]
MNRTVFYFATTQFEGARQLVQLPNTHPASRLHGHSFQTVVVTPVNTQWENRIGMQMNTLMTALHTAVEPLNYADLNRQLPMPSDAHLAHWLNTRLALPNATLFVNSTPQQGAELTANHVVILKRRYQFEAAHYLPQVPNGHPCGRMHGHRFGVILRICALELNVVTHSEQCNQLDALWQTLSIELHHQCLNHVPGLENPTSEHLCQWIWQRLTSACPALFGVAVIETATAGCHYDGQQFCIWKDQRFESARQLCVAPAGDGHQQLQGHSYLLRLHLCAPLDTVLGWTVDYGEVKALFQPIYAQLDHHLLNELPQLTDTDVGSLVTWISARATNTQPELVAVELQQQPGCGAICCVGESLPPFLMLDH